jgi:hypothetical protein
MNLLSHLRMTALACMCTCTAAGATPATAGPMWLTIVGDAQSPTTDTVEVDATSAVAFESMRMVKLRVNRAKPRMGFDGKPYQSYYSTAIVNCGERKQDAGGRRHRR